MNKENMPLIILAIVCTAFFIYALDSSMNIYLETIK